MHVSWIAFTRCLHNIDTMLKDNAYFKLDQNPGFLKPIGVAAARSYRPWLVSPNIDVWQEIERKINKESRSLASGRSSVLTLSDFEGQPRLSYGFTVRLYRPNVICIEIKCLNNIDVRVEEAFATRALECHLAAKLALDALIGIIKSGDTKNYEINNSYYVRPSFIFALDIPRDTFLDWRDQNKKAIVGLLINNRNFGLADEALSTAIIERNKDVDIKYEKAALSLVSKQGILTAFSIVDTEFARQIRREHEKRTRFLEYALALQNYAEIYPQFRSVDENTADFLLYLTLPYIKEGAYFPRSVTGTFTWAILSKEIGLPGMVDIISDVAIKEVAKKESLFLQMSHESYDSLEYRSAVRAATRWYTRRWIANDIAGSKVIPWILTAILSIIIAIMKIK